MQKFSKRPLSGKTAIYVCLAELTEEFCVEKHIGSQSPHVVLKQQMWLFKKVKMIISIFILLFRS